MSRRVDIITTLYGEDAEQLEEEIRNPPKNPALERTLERARRFGPL